jgi:hypothetical protein
MTATALRTDSLTNDTFNTGTTDEQIADEVRAAHDAYTKAEADADLASEIAGQRKAEANQRRIDLGRALLKARAQWPERGPRAKGWGKLLEKLGIPQQTAYEWMQIAEHADISPANADAGETSQRRAAGLDNRPSKSKPRASFIFDRSKLVELVQMAIRDALDHDAPIVSLAAGPRFSDFDEEDRKVVADVLKRIGEALIICALEASSSDLQ